MILFGAVASISSCAFSADSAAFVFINSALATPVTDVLMPIVTNNWFLRVLATLVAIVALWKGDRKVRWAVLFCVMTIVLVDQVSSGILKPFFERTRPCHQPELFDQLRLLVHCGAGKSFPSSHAANSFAVAVFIMCAERKVRWYLLVGAAIVALSRVFVGVHYLGDILAGALFGATMGLIAARLYRRLFM